MFNSCTQEQGEKFNAYLIKLRHQIKTCEYGALEDELLHDRIVTGTSNNNARLLGESGVTLDRVIDICRRTEQAEQQLSKLNNSAETIHYTKADKKKKARELIKDCKFGGLNHLWILSWCHMDYISFGPFRLVLWHRADIPWWVFGYCPLSSYLGFLELMLCALGSCYDGDCVSD